MNETISQPQWYFRKYNPYDDLSASTTADSFIEHSIKNMATALVREGIQNAMDARQEHLPADQPVQVRLTLAKVDVKGELHNKWFGGVWDHLTSPNAGVPDPPSPNDSCPLLIFEDFGTTGLTGDYRAPHKAGSKNNFCNFLYHEGITGKGNKQRGSRGVGKVVFTMASRARTFFALTLRKGERKLLLTGKNVLKPHEKDDRQYGSGYFLGRPWELDQPREPVFEEHVINSFSNTFPVTRTDEAGLSVVIPFLDTSVTAPALREAVICEYHYAILSGKLEVTLNNYGKEETFSASHLPYSGDESIEAQVDLARWAVAHKNAATELVIPAPEAGGLQRLEPEQVNEDIRTAITTALEQHRRIVVRLQLYTHPKDGDPQLGYCDLFLEYADTYNQKPAFVREMLPVSGVHEARAASHVRALVVIAEGPLADLLRAAEGTNHTDWSPRADNFSQHYVARKGEIAFVACSVFNLMSIVRGDNEKPVGGIATRFFFAQLENKPEKPGKRPKGKGPKSPDKPDDPPPPKLKSYIVSQIDGGFTIRRGDPDAPLPERLVVRAAYDVLRGSAWSQWESADFDFTKENKDIEIIAHHAEIDRTRGKGNRFDIVPESDDFDVRVTGFDPHRDVIIDTKKEKETENADETELHEPVEAAAG